MDPQATWHALMDAFRQLDWERVLELTDALLHWLHRGGFPPETAAIAAQDSLGPGWNRAMAKAGCRFARELAILVLSDPDGIPQGLPFRLSCRHCRNLGPATAEDAQRFGWDAVQFVPVHPSENFLGRCPACRQRGDSAR